MSDIAEYKLHNIKETTPVIHYKCAWCGKEGVRRASKVKNPNLIFCNNHCSLMYRNARKYAENNKRIITDKDVNSLFNKYYRNIQCMCFSMINKYQCNVDIDELLRVSKTACYYIIKNSKDRNNIDKKYVHKYINRYLKYYFINDIFGIQHNLENNYDKVSIDGFKNNDKVHYLAVEKDYIQEIEEEFDRQIKLKLVEGIIESKAKSKMMRMTFDRYVREMPIDKMMLKWGYKNKREIVDRCYLGKKNLEKELKLLTR